MSLSGRRARGKFVMLIFLKSRINFLLTEHEGCTGEYWPEVVAVRTERSEVRTKMTEGQYSPVRPSRSVSKKFIIWLFNHLLLCFCKPVIGPWALRENDALQFSHN